MASQGDSVADRVFGQPDFFTGSNNTGGRSASSLFAPTGVAVDAAGNLYVVELGNSRVLEFDSPLTTDTVADRVFGQPDFFTGDCNTGGRSASSLCFPVGVAVDANGNLYVADGSNNRVLEYDNPLATDRVADRVFGQPNFFTGGCNTGSLSASSLCGGPHMDVAVDVTGNLYVSDGRMNHRVLEYDSPLTTDSVADRVFGQPDFFTGGCNTGGRSASSLCNPTAVAVDGSGNLYVAESLFTSPAPSNNRVLEYDSPLTTDTVADRVFGQPDFFTGGCHTGGRSCRSLCAPRGIAIDAFGNLYVGDQDARVLEYDSPLTTDTVADRVFGQPDFVTEGCNGELGSGFPTARTLCQPTRVAVDGAGNLFVADAFGNNRVLEYDSPLTLTLAGLRATVEGLALDSQVKNRLLGKLDAAQRALDRNNTEIAKNKLQDFIHQVEGQRGIAMSDCDADLLVKYASNLISILS